MARALSTTTGGREAGYEAVDQHAEECDFSVSFARCAPSPEQG